MNLYMITYYIEGEGDFIVQIGASEIKEAIEILESIVEKEYLLISVMNEGRIYTKEKP